MKHRTIQLIALCQLLLQSSIAFSTHRNPPPFKVSSSKEPRQSETAVVFLPGCMMDPSQYNGLVQAIQELSNQKVWVDVPNLPFKMANPLTVPNAIKQSIQNLRKNGYKGKKIFLAGHSLGGVFLPDQLTKEFEMEIAGMIFVGSFEPRSGVPVDVPRLTVCGELDGLVRTSRIAEAYHQSSTETVTPNELHKPVVLVEGMNHFQFLEGKPHFMKQGRDLEPEISDQQALYEVSSTIVEFLDYHTLNQDNPAMYDIQSSLASRVQSSGKHLKPILDAMKLEGRIGNHHSKGSRWSEIVQKTILDNVYGIKNLGSHKINDEFHPSWKVQPDPDKPFFHPKVLVHEENETNERKIELQTISQNIYEMLGELFDTGFFSSAATEIRAKFNSPQAVCQVLANNEIEISEKDNIEDIAGLINNMTIQWAIDSVPNAVRHRYEKRGVKLVAGQDVCHNNGPGWIWSRLNYRRQECNGEKSMVIQSHTMSTPTNHFIPTVQGKLYMKLLSPAKAMDWIYTDSLRGDPSEVFSFKFTQKKINELFAFH